MYAFDDGRGARWGTAARSRLGVATASRLVALVVAAALLASCQAAAPSGTGSPGSGGSPGAASTPAPAVPSAAPSSSGTPQPTPADRDPGATAAPWEPGLIFGPSPAPPSGSPPPTRVATRVIVPRFGIDLAVVTPPRDHSVYPWCNVAMYLRELSQPGMPGTTYIYAHARKGMFLPLLLASQVRNGRDMLGTVVYVYTSDDLRFSYQVSAVYRHQTTLRRALGPREQLFLQTSEGPKGTIPKLQVEAQPVGVDAVAHADAHPRGRPVRCG